jgi:hypothetical protein
MRKLFFITMIYLPFDVNGQIRGANHIGSEEMISINDLTKLISKLSGKKVK